MTETAPKTPWIKLLNYRQTWAFVIGKFLTDPIWWFFLFWLPAFLESTIWHNRYCHSLACGIGLHDVKLWKRGRRLLPMYLIKKGWPVFKARKTSMLIYAFCVVPVVFAQWLGSINMWLAVINDRVCSFSPPGMER